MKDIIKTVDQIEWQGVTNQLHVKGFAIVPGFLSEIHCQQLIEMYNDVGRFRKKVVMERFRFGLGEYQYFDYPLPGIIQAIREKLYPQLVPIANQWMQMLGIDRSFPKAVKDLLTQCRFNSQLKPTPLLLKYGVGGFNTPWIQI